MLDYGGCKEKSLVILSSLSLKKKTKKETKHKGSKRATEKQSYFSFVYTSLMWGRLQNRNSEEREKLKAMTRLGSTKLVSLCVQEMQFW